MFNCVIFISFMFFMWFALLTLTTIPICSYTFLLSSHNIQSVTISMTHFITQNQTIYEFYKIYKFLHILAILHTTQTQLG